MQQYFTTPQQTRQSVTTIHSGVDLSRWESSGKEEEMNGWGFLLLNEKKRESMLELLMQVTVTDTTLISYSILS